MNATRLLESQHRQVESLIRQLGSRTAPREQLLRELADNLAAHMLIEEEMFYPAAAPVVGRAVLQNYEEHQVEVPVVERLLATCDADVFDARLAVLIDLMRPHISEEENSLFPQMDRALPPELNARLGAEMAARFQEVLPLGYAQILALRPDPSGIPGGICSPAGAPAPAPSPEPGAPGPAAKATAGRKATPGQPRRGNKGRSA